MARSSVPKFGNWENEDNVPYTVYFDKARKNRGGTMINPNDPQENPNMFPKTRPDEPIGLRPKTPEQGPARSARPSARSEQSYERSPLHPHYLAKVTGRASGSPAWEGRNNGSSHGAPVRSRVRPARGDESPNKDAAAVPKFGEWNENDPQSAENFTHIFNRVRNERNTGGIGNPSGTPKHPSSYNTRTQQSDEPYKKCCFPWW